MTEALARVKPRVRALEPYRLRAHRPRIKLNQNESPYDFPDDLKELVLAEAQRRPWHRYPSFQPTLVREAAAARHDWPVEGVLAANGSNELILATFLVSVEPGVRVGFPEPTFALYRLLAELLGAEVVPLPTPAPFALDADALIEAARRQRLDVLVVCSPNNPTGAALDADSLARLHDETDALVVVDQAYVDFGGADARPLLPGRPRLVVLRTLSKAFALAGLRAGYLLADPALVEQIDKARLPYNVNLVTELAAAAALRAADRLRPIVEEVRRTRARLLARLQALPGVEAFPSEANFVLFRLHPPAPPPEVVFARLLGEYGILVRDVSRGPHLAGCLRVSVGTPEETEAFLTALTAVFEASHAS